jgi:hypothetical protein
VSQTYSVVKSVAGGASQGVAEWLRSEDEDASLAWAVVKGGGIGAAETVRDMVIDKVVGEVVDVLKPGTGLDRIELPEIELGGQSVGSVAQTLLDPDDPLGGGVLKTLGVSQASGHLEDEVRAPIEAAVEAVTGQEE